VSILKCKMCGGDLEVTEDMKIVECDYCGTKQTVPNADNEKKVNLFNRANRLRMASEFDKATVIYENIIAEFPEEAEAYWGLCLCNYGIEYVDDPATAKKIPTCHRASFESLQKDENFELALEYADVVAQKVYRDEAREIDRIMGEILAISKNEKPYDVFICYKETDEKGERTVDSVLAYDIYDALTAKGFNVFFSRVTLEDKLGMQYEPYIFAALNSAKVMLSIGTKYEYFHAVWVKNEWSRFLKLMKKDKSKVLIPCFKDIDAYDMPEEFKALQAQDLGKLGAVQDIVRGVLKIITPISPVAPIQTPIVQKSTQQVVKQEIRKPPVIINNVSSMGTVRDELWPKGTYSNVINLDQFRHIRFFLAVSKQKLCQYSTIHLKFYIFNSSGLQILDHNTDISWAPDYDKISQGWVLRGEDGSAVPTGNYKAAFSVNDSQWFYYSFTVTSNAAESRRWQEAQQFQQQQQYQNNQMAQQTFGIMGQRRQYNLCQYCGGDFKGVLIKKCSVCGKVKDY